MRKNLYLGLIACAALTMTGCSNDEISYDSSKQEAQAIQFDTYLGKNVQGRAQELGGTGKQLTDFGVFASYTQSAAWSTTEKMNFMFNQKVEKKGSDWAYTPLKYWPEKKGEKISFFAYAPYFDNTDAAAITEVSVNTDTGAPKVNFAIDIDATKMVDFTAGVKMDVSPTLTNTEEQNKVTFTLHHELARVNFAAKLDRDAFDEAAANKTKVNVTNLKIEAGDKFVKSADYTFSTTNDVTTESGTTVTRGTWGNYIYTSGDSEDLNVTPILNTASATELGTYTESGVIVSTETEVNLFQDNHYLFFIPAEDNMIDTDVIKVTITYDIVTKDTALDGGYAKSTATKTVNLKAANFEQGKAKKYVFEIGLHEVKVDASVEAWDPEAPGNGTTVNGTDVDA